VSGARRLGRGFNPLLLQIAAVIAGGAVVVGIALYTGDVVERSSHNATDESQAALLASEITSQIDSLSVFGLRSEEVSASGTGAPTLGLADAIAAHEALSTARQEAVELHRLIGSDKTLQIMGAAGEAADGLDEFITARSPETYGLLETRLAGLRGLSAAEAPRLHASAEGHQATLLDATSNARLATIIAAVVSAMCVAAATLIIGRRLRHALETVEGEKARLVETSRIMQRRNEQFGALYQVVSEVTETLSMKYVVKTTIHEARKLVGADAVTLRRLENGDLIVAGSEGDVEMSLAALTPIQLGMGVVGRAAKRGKTTRLDSGAAAHMIDGERIDGMESGIVVPLIVGARVVGALSCWSRETEHFNTDDERILEMMASQVATAIVSADTHEQTERDAHEDALTTLPNRRQLHEDLRGPLLNGALNDHPLAIAMVDIDHFKRFNDDYGHKVGDVTLQRVAEVLRASVRERDRVYRFGGEEFLIVFDGVASDDAMKLAERVRSAVQRTPLTGDSMQPVGPVTISIGVAVFPDHGRDVDELIDVADRAMYASKEMGRNRVTLSGAEPEAAALEAAAA
jgi:diguanylate cyclase (GGDEF)-like protein